MKPLPWTRRPQAPLAISLGCKTGFIERDIARLQVLETWKGRRIDNEFIEIHFDADQICPTPPRFETGRTVILFLDRWNGTWIVPDASFGGIAYPDDPAKIDRRRQWYHQERRLQERWSSRGFIPAVADSACEDLEWTARVTSWPWSRADESGDSPRAGMTAAHRRLMEASAVPPPPPIRDLTNLLFAMRGFKNPHLDQLAVDVLDARLQSAPERGDTDFEVTAFELLLERLGEHSFELAPTWLGRVSSLMGLTSQAPLPQRWQSFRQRHRLNPRLVLPQPRSTP
ncbi:hypothetical protein LZ198_32375 [Myxococcus sp. K15C18031901]|uniref:hypothetical protein n=1 Tax=Myxococcus dinghuensis TaxID=2906761 RepID=UPI0020A7605A|nr:hypothetical protein [Myxococcus dinghuensis]MCP3103590.1 hypothetical protein [Myxococcus dinghuensis]